MKAATRETADSKAAAAPAADAVKPAPKRVVVAPRQLQLLSAYLTRAAPTIPTTLAEAAAMQPILQAIEQASAGKVALLMEMPAEETPNANRV